MSKQLSFLGQTNLPFLRDHIKAMVEETAHRMETLQDKYDVRCEGAEVSD